MAPRLGVRSGWLTVPVRQASLSGVHAEASAHDLTFHDKYCLGSKLGKGSFGQVYVAKISNRINGDTTQSTSDGGDVRAVKIVDMQNVKGDQDRYHRALQNEIFVWAKLRNRQHCVHLHEVFQSEGLIYMVMEKCDISLLSYLDGLVNGLNERSLGEIFAQMLTGLKDVHSLSIVHRDIKPDNFFVGGKNGTTVKLGDFGLSESTSDETNGKASGEYGTAPYMCPEMVAQDPYDEKADVWSFGVLVYVLLFGRFPYTPAKKTIADMKMAILQDAKKPDFLSSIPLTASAIAFSKNLLDRNPATRPSTADALDMDYMTAAMTKSNDFGDNLPSLRSTLRSAVKVRAFENNALTQDGLDEKLDRLQMKKLGTPTTETPQLSGHPSMSAFTALSRNTSASSNTTSASQKPKRATVVSIDSKSTIVSIDSMASTNLESEVLGPWGGSFTNWGSCTCDV